MFILLYPSSLLLVSFLLFPSFYVMSYRLCRSQETSFWHLSSIYRGLQGEKFERSGARTLRAPPPSSPSTSLLPPCAVSTKILRGLSAYAFVTCVSQAATAAVVVFVVVVAAHPCLMARRKALPRRPAASETSYF